jgi:hypothetical protein
VDDAGTWVLLIYLYMGGMLAYGIYLAAQIHANKVHSEVHFLFPQISQPVSNIFLC